jgi:hypothetical protein
MKGTRKRKTAKRGTKLRSLGNSKVVAGSQDGRRTSRLRSLGDATKVVAPSSRGTASRGPM